MKIDTRFTIPQKDPRNANIASQYPIDKAAWIWHPQPDTVNGNIVEFKLDLNHDQDRTIDVHVSADNRYELYLDEVLLSEGPDRSDANHWAFTSLKLTIKAGCHTLKARCWHFPDSTGAMTAGQIIVAPGFILAAGDPELKNTFNTGYAPWRVRLVNGFSVVADDWRCTGRDERLDIAAYYQETTFVEPKIVRRACKDDIIYGVKVPLWRLTPTNLPEQIRQLVTRPKRVRAVLHTYSDENIVIAEADAAPSDEMARSQAFVDGKQDLTLPPHTQLAILLDLEDYLCAYPEIIVSQGQNARISIKWTEALHAPQDESEKGNRSEIIGKVFDADSQGDFFYHFDGPRRSCMPHYWSAGRYVLIQAETQDTPLTLHRLNLWETRYPLEAESAITFDDESLNAIQPLMIRSLQACTHETYMDCPYYEQLMYVGDTRLEVLTFFSLLLDSRLPLRTLQLFDWSRSDWQGLVAEHFPGRGAQLSATYSCIWPLMVQDFMMYRRFDHEQDFLNLRLGVRKLLLTLSSYVNQEGLIENLPGWSFVDWVRYNGWNSGIPFPGSNTAAASLFSLHYLMALKAAMALEDYLPEPNGGLLPWYSEQFNRTAAAVKTFFWKHDKALFADDLGGQEFSIHAQCLAILSGLLDEAQTQRCIDAMLSTEGLAQPTIYFIYYLFETLKRHGRTERIFDYTYLWKDMLKSGGLTSFEAPEPTRSDCHAWGSHLYHHFFASIVGIRPESIGFRTVSFTPVLGPLKHAKGQMVHPDGMISFEIFQASDHRLSGFITLPPNVSGHAVLNGCTVFLHEGTNTF